MSSQRYSLSAQLTHIVCSRRHLPALLSVMAGSVCSLLFVSPKPGPCENACSWGCLGADWRIPTAEWLLPVEGETSRVVEDLGCSTSQGHELGVPRSSRWPNL